MVSEIINFGEVKNTRAGKTLVIPGFDMVLDLSRGNLPLLSLKKTPLNAIASELWFFLNGITSKATLRDDLGCSIWNEWCNPKAKSFSQTAEEVDDLGPVYGYQWRSFNRHYEPNAPRRNPIRAHAAGGYSESEGYDQLGELCYKLRMAPDDRRMVVSAWNPMQMDQMALPPCHLLFNVIHINGTLHLHWYQRSCDVMLGVPFNICSYGLLLHLLCFHGNFKPGTLRGHFADFHIYDNHLDAAKSVLNRESRRDPTLYIPTVEQRKAASTDAFSLVGEPPYHFDLFQWAPRDVEALNYNPHPFIKLPVAV